MDLSKPAFAIFNAFSLLSHAKRTFCCTYLTYPKRQFFTFETSLPLSASTALKDASHLYMYVCTYVLFS